MTPTEDVIRKIKKLMQIANRPSSHEESAIIAAATEDQANMALSKAQELMAVYNLEMHQINAAEDPSKQARHKRVRHTAEKTGLFEYQRKLWEAVAKVNHCWYEAIPVYKTNTLGVVLKANYQHFLIGSEVNVLSATLMGEYLESTISRINPYKSGKSQFSWKEGCAARLIERLDTKRYELERESKRAAEKAQEAGGTSTALVTLTNVYQTEEDLNYLEKWGQEAYERRLAYRHDRDNCQCKYCATNREFWKRVNEEQKQAVLVKEDAPVETEAQRRKREEREQKRNDRYWEQQKRKEDAKWAKKDMNAYVKGFDKADDIGLDKQVKEGGAGRLK